MTDLSNHQFPSVLVVARKPRESWRDRWHHLLLQLQFMWHRDEAERYAYVLVDGKVVKHKVVEPPRLGKRNWMVSDMATGKRSRVTSTHISRVTGSLDDSGMGK